MRAFLFSVFFLLAAFVHLAPAQLQVSIDIPRTLYIKYEPVLAKVQITNLSGRDIELSDSANIPWFGFTITTENGNPILPRNRNYILPPMVIPIGQSIARRVNLTPIYPLTRLGSYRVRATVYDRQSGEYYNSKPEILEITEGRIIWSQRVGNPQDNSTRIVTLLSHLFKSTTSLYLRIEDEKIGIVYCTYRLGGLLDSGKPEIKFDYQNQVHVLNQRAPRSFIYSHIGLNGEIYERLAYMETTTRPHLQGNASGSVQVVGGAVYDPKEVKAKKEQEPSVSDRPAPIPDLKEKKKKTKEELKEERRKAKEAEKKAREERKAIERAKKEMQKQKKQAPPQPTPS
ncbi:MAG: hypothetical protein ACK5NG_10385 [Chthoniobacterales bacterium]